MQQSIATDTLFYGDNLTIMPEYIAKEMVDLVCLGPPFNSNRKRIMTPWSEEDHPVGEEKRASRVGQPSVTTMVTMGSSSTSVWLSMRGTWKVGVEGCLERIGEDYPEEERLFRDLWEDETQRDVVVESLKADCEVRTGRPAGL